MMPEPTCIAQIRQTIAQNGGLANAARLATEWELSPERARQITQRSDFPQRIGVLGRSPIWLFDQCKEWRARSRPVGQAAVKLRSNPEAIRRTAHWARWPWLPIVRSIGDERQFGLLHADDVDRDRGILVRLPSDETAVALMSGDLIDPSQLRELDEWDSLELLLRDGWMVDDG
jgi:hypothetical protein